MVFLGFLQMPAFLQCEEGVRKETFVSLFRIDKVWGGMLWSLGWGGVSSSMKVRFLKWDSVGHLRASNPLPPERLLFLSLLCLPHRGC